MSRTLFENSKAALAFAGITIAGAALMIGTSDGGGLLDRVTHQYGEEREAIVEEAKDFAKKQSVPDEVFDADSGWGSASETFGDYQPSAKEEDPEPEDFASSPAPTPGRAAANQANAQKLKKPSLTQQVPPPAVSDNPGTLVPRPDQGQTRAAQRGVAVITERELTITPQLSDSE